MSLTRKYLNVIESDELCSFAYVSSRTITNITDQDSLGNWKDEFIIKNFHLPDISVLHHLIMFKLEEIGLFVHDSHQVFFLSKNGIKTDAVSIENQFNIVVHNTDYFKGYLFYFGDDKNVRVICLSKLFDKIPNGNCFVIKDIVLVLGVRKKQNE